MNKNESLSELFPQNTAKRLLLHTCCAPCSGSIAQRIREEDIDCTLFYYNPNIYPAEEYQRRKDEQKRFAEKHHFSFMDFDYNPQDWTEYTKGFEKEPERGKRCTSCFDLRLRRTAQHALEHGFAVFATTLGLSRWKDLAQVNRCGQEAAKCYPGTIFWDINWRKKGGSRLMYEVAKHEHFYKQEYCGCIYSYQETERKRINNKKKSLPTDPQYY